MTQRLSPRLMDAFVLRFGFEAQKTNEPRSENAPNNLFEPIQGYDRVEGDFSDQSLSRSLYNWLEMRPVIRGAITGTTLGLMALRAVRGRRNGT